MQSALSLIDELESTMRVGSGAQRAEILQRVTQLFLQCADSYGADQVALFDDVIMRLIEQIEQQALIRLSSELAPIGNAPGNVVRQLALNDSIDVSRPVLRQSSVLTDDFLVSIAKSKSQDHLSAIAERPQVAEAVTDILVERGNAEVTMKVTGNAGARFSKRALFEVARRANTDSDLAEIMVCRSDIPHDVFEHLLSKATEVVRQRLQKTASPNMRNRINQTLHAINRQAVKSGTHHGARTAASLAHMDASRRKAMLTDAARGGDRAQTIEILSALSKLPAESIKSLVRAEAEDGMLILCKAVGLGWSDAKPVLAVMTGIASQAPADTKRAFDKYYRLTEETALRVIRFVKSCKAVSKADLQRML